MLLGGLWHGASWNFVAWGALHGLGLCLHKLWLDLRPRLGGSIDWDALVWRVAALLLTQFWVLCAWTFFRCDSFADALQILQAMVGLRHVAGQGLPLALNGWIIGLIVVDHVLGRTRLRSAPAVDLNRSVFWVGIGAIAAVAMTLMPQVQKAFIYFQF